MPPVGYNTSQSTWKDGDVPATSRAIQSQTQTAYQRRPNRSQLRAKYVVDSICSQMSLESQLRSIG
jgi:hypothetical protein